ncbi:hypothetical protein, partial [Thiolapillus sp.]|uniref:hypothetical protein n=1 Tax=Thiolapillus sp. TaxID=2017437 RepID=UPI003AF72484
MTRTAGAQIGCQRLSRFWGLGCPKIYHEAEDTLEHGNKPNLAQYVRGQCWVSLAWVIRREKQPVALPLLTRLVP